jgi:hypothetical protein
VAIETPTHHAEPVRRIFDVTGLDALPEVEFLLPSR